MPTVCPASEYFSSVPNGWRRVGAFLLRGEGMDHANFDGIAPSAT